MQNVFFALPTICLINTSKRYYTPVFRVKQHMKKIISFVCFIAASLFGYTQQETKPTTQQDKLEKLKGTYEIVSEHRFFTLPSNLADIITENRQSNESVVKRLSPETTLIIYPYSAIQSTGKEQKKK